MQEINLFDIEGFRIGHEQNEEAATGCTVVLFDRQTPVGIDIRGGGPASRETPLMDPRMAAEGLHAILLSGGSAYGLDAAGGVMRFLEERQIGLRVGPTVVPLVCQSDIFDLGIGRYDVRPDAEMAYSACLNASRASSKSGSIGVGTGCTAGKLRGMGSCMKTGIGSYAVACGKILVGALIAVNALGNVYDPETGVPIAGTRDDSGTIVSSEELLWNSVDHDVSAMPTNTTIGVVFTNCRFNKGELTKIAGMAQDGYARSIRPVHTMNDGDTVYAASVGDIKANLDVVGTLAAYVTSKAVVAAALSAQGAYGLPSANDI